MENRDLQTVKVNAMLDQAFAGCEDDLYLSLFREWLALKNFQTHTIKFFVSAKIYDDDIATLELSTRPENGLRRNGLNTIGQLVGRCSNIEGFKYMKNLGINSAKEIMLALFCHQFSSLTPINKKRYAARVLLMNEEAE